VCLQGERGGVTGVHRLFFLEARIVGLDSLGEIELVFPLC